MKPSLVTIVLELLVNALAWKLTYSTFGNKIISSADLSGWINPLTGNSAQITSCAYSGIQAIWISSPNLQAQKEIKNIIPHYKIKSVQDFYFYYSFNDEYTAAYMDGNQIFYKVWDYQANMDFYGNICESYPASYTFDLYTIIGTLNSHQNNNLFLKYTTDVDSPLNNEALFIRNIQVYIKPCFETCLTCSGDLPTNCITCHYSTQSGGSCNYCSNPQLQFTHSLLGCIQECPVYYLADQNNFCAPNSNLINQLQAYQGISFSTQDFSFVEDQTNGGSIIIYSKIQICNSQSLSGYFHYNDLLQKQITIPKGTSKLRIRATFYFFNNWANQEQIQMLIENVSIGSLYYNGGVVYSRNCKIISKTLNQVCNSNNYDQIRIEQLINFDSSKSAILLAFQASLKPNQIQSWGIRDITVDVLLCSFNCDLCDNENNCNTCSAGYKLHKGQCIQNCPSYTTTIGSTCKDFDEETQMTKYSIKAFYDLSTDDEEANNMFSLVSQTAPNFAKGSSIYFSYLDNKRIFGGTLVWRKAKFQKIISITEPHHGIRLRMVVILGDDFSGGSFIYTINSVSTTLSRSTAGGIDQQIWGSYQNEYQISVDTNKVPNTLSGSYTLSVECVNNKAINVAWCGISDLFVTVYRCPFQCGSCTNDATCNSQLGASHYNSALQICSDGYYKDYYANDCKQCQRSYCQKCDDLYTCTECDTTFTLTVYGTCSCQDNQTIKSGQCVDCHPLCLTCFDSTQSSCLQCSEGNHRFLTGSQCECLPYFQEVGSYKCEPICGDMIVVGNEECDDGNENRFDGCHKCKFECQEECTNCLNGKCQKCKENFVLHPILYKCYQKEVIPDYTYPNFFYACGDGIKQENEECDDANVQPFDGCHNCQYSCVEHCQNCIMGSCIRCEIGWLYDEFTLVCLEIQQPSYSTIAYQMDFYDVELEKEFCTEQVNGVCLKCNTKLGFQLAQNRNFCYYNCGSQPFIDQYSASPFQESWVSKCEYPCPKNCLQCSFGICQQCQNNYYLTSNECISKCGDLAVVDLEECDDSNEDRFDGCWKCQYSCDLNCSSCISGFCSKCNLGYEINYSSGLCEPICGDSLITDLEQCDEQSINCYECNFKCTQFCKDCVYGVCSNCLEGFKLTNGFCESQCGDGILNDLEECDDGNDIQFDGCFNCRIDCPENCKQCTLDHCQQCVIGWTYNMIIEECEPVCGDGLVRGWEQCDDGNDTPLDGCYECEFQCQLECDYCYFGVCYECIKGWSLNIHSCQPICGDGLVVGTEQCDDGNDQPYDGCHQCQYSCDRNCLDCEKGICILCEVGYVESGPTCLSICGDGQVALGNEQCDDQNNLDGDGCSFECKIENGWVCTIDFLLSHCELSDPPLMYLDIVDDGEQIKIIEIKFSQKLLQSEVPTQFRLSLISDELTDDDFTLELFPKQIANYFEQVEVVYQVKIEYFKNCLKSQLVVELVDQNSLINQFDQPIGNQIVKANLQQTNFLEDYQKQISQGINSMVNIIFYGIIVLFGISVICCNLDIMWNTLDLLQFLSYLKYVNVPFPSNLQYFFVIFDQVSLGPILDLIGFKKLMYYLQGSEFAYIEPSQRFAKDNINALFMDNIASVLFALLFFHIFRQLQIFSLNLFSKIDAIQYLRYQKIIYIRMLLFVKKALRFEIFAFYFSDLIRLFLSSSYELYFALYLQLYTLKFSEGIFIINCLMCILLLIVVTILTLRLLFNLNAQQNNKQNNELYRLQSLFEDVSTHSYFSTIFNSLYLIRRNMFMFILVFLQNAPLIQTLLIALNSAIFFVYLFQSNPQRNDSHAFNIRFTEIVVQCCCSIFLLFEINNNCQQIFYFNVYLILGWICIGLISSCLFTQFVLDLYQQILFLRSKYKQFTMKFVEGIDKRLDQNSEYPKNQSFSGKFFE